MQEHYGIDLAEPGLLERRSARWLKVRISGLLLPITETLFAGDRLVELPRCRSRLHCALFPPEKGGDS